MLRHRVLDTINVVMYAVTNAEHLETARLQRASDESSP